jgi:tRNA threonylcarbamoyladenosine biosynthesis protein TsaB
MKILAIDTSSTAASVALLINDELQFIHRIVPMQQAQLILPMIDELLQQAELDLKQLDALAFGCGPGSFTGLRIAASVIQGLGFATQLPIISISSLAALAQATYDELGWKNLLVGIDARMQEVYWGVYQANEQGLVKLVGEEIISPPNLLTPPSYSAGWYGVGDGWEVYKADLLTQFKPIAVDVTRLPMATAIANLAKDKFLKKEWVATPDALPVYLRNNVAKPPVRPSS